MHWQVMQNMHLPVVQNMHWQVVQRYALAKSAKVCTGKKCKDMHWHTVHGYALAKSFTDFYQFPAHRKMAKCLET